MQEKNTQLLDEISSYNNIENVKNEELPEKLEITKQNITLKFKNCTNFIGPVIYNITYNCISDWCSTERPKNEIINFDKYNVKITKNLTLISNTKYNISITAIRRDNKKTISGVIKTLSINNLTVCWINESTIRLKWKKIDPPSEYYMRYNKQNTTFNGDSMLPCENNFVCANVTVQGLTYKKKYKIEVNDKFCVFILIKIL